ncbi:M20/M25/M40 family metallo-hydrolase [Paenibacillus glycinis]|uniref:M20/M25/M40 family metallo-hydrolase n=1 Tax=Paenibacillus glycinis TaxID=2697035 RepID=A0ABW9XPI5_9BACL|nr:M20/M25/M40 family metallo-hydrolase [Paenibacillus glycinis]NBD24471.1 M20/M25/M40 family metallo-hydrolase [Paenibacillus glycinis]
MFKKMITQRLLSFLLVFTMAVSTFVPAAYAEDANTGGPGTVETDPAAETPSTETPTETPTSDAPTSETPSTETPTTEAPTTEAPTTEAPTTEAPSADPASESSVAALDAPVLNLKEGEVGYAASQYLTYLSTTIGTRTAGSDPDKAAGDYIKGEFEKMGLSATKQEFSYTRSGNTVTTNNIIATKPGLSDKTLIIGAHYDSVSSGGSMGADDNASGVAVMMESALAVASKSTPYTIKFIAFGAEEAGTRGSQYYVSQMDAAAKKNTVAMINLDSVAVGDDMNIYGNAGFEGFVRDQGLAIADRLDLNIKTNPGLNPAYPAGTTGDWSDHAAFRKAGIPYGYLEATNWTLGDLDGYTQTVLEGEVWHTGKDNLAHIIETYPGRIEEHLTSFTKLLTALLLELKEPEVQPITLSDDKASMTEKRTIDVEFELPTTSAVTDLQFTYGGKPLSDWKKWSTTSTPAGYTGDPFIYLEGTPVVEGTKVKAKITFDLIYGTADLSGTYRTRYPEMIGTHDLEVLGKTGNVFAAAPIKLNPYDSFHLYDEIKPAIDAITAKAKEGRYIETRVLGQSSQGRDIYFTILAKDKASVDQYVNETLPAMMNDPAGLQTKIKSGKLSNYKVPIWINNIHPDEAPGIDAILNIFDAMSSQDTVTYDTTDEAGKPKTVTIDVNQALDNVIFLLDYTENPDGRYLNTRANANGFDLNRDNSYQTQPETQIVASEIAKWSPTSFLDFHGFVKQFLIEPCTPPHDPNFEYDLLIDNMVDQANAMGRAGVANTKYDVYHIPYEEARKKAADPDYKPIANATGWDDASPAYTAVFAMHQGSLGHTVEIPELNEDSVSALFFTAMASTKYVMDNKKELFLNQLEVYKRGIENVDSYSVDKYLINASNEVIGRPRDGEDNFFPEYYVLPVDAGLQKNALEVYNMVQYLLRNSVKVEKSTVPVTVGTTVYPAGSYIVNMHQAKRGYANLVLYDGIDVSDFSAMYADIIQSFSYMRGFDRYIVRDAGAFAAKTAPVTSLTVPTTQITGYTVHYVIRDTNNAALQAVNELVKAGKSVTMLDNGGTGYEKGDFLVSYANLKTVMDKYLLDVVPFEESGSKEGKVLKPIKVAATGVPAFVLNSLGFDVTGSAAEGDVLVNTSNSNSYISAGTPYIGFGRSVMNSLKSSNLLTGFNFATTGNAHEGLFETILDQDSVITAPYEDTEYLYTVSGSYITAVPEGADVIATASSDDDFYLAGWWPNHDRAKGSTIAFTYKTDALNVTVFANELTNRDHPQFQFRLLANAIFAAEPAKEGTVDDGDGSHPEQPGNGGGTGGGGGGGGTGTTDPTTPTEPVNPTEPTTPTDPTGPVLGAPAFTDLGPVASWAKDAIESLASKGIVKGIDDKGSFAPLKQVTRAEFLTMLVRAFDLKAENATISFSDVKSGAWYYEAVAAAVEAGIAQGVGGGKFDPNRPITREEMAIMAANLLSTIKDLQVTDVAGQLSKFKDQGSMASYAKEAIALLTQTGVITGTSADAFTPKGIANRAQAAVIISRILELGSEA